MNKNERVNYWHTGHLDVHEETRNGKTFSMVDVDRIREFLDSVPVSYAYTVNTSGTMANGSTYVAVTLTVEFDDGSVTVAGGADSTFIGLPGLIGEALRNAVLRGLSMGKSLYEQGTREVATEYEQPDHTQSYVPQTPDTSTGYTNTTTKREFGTWDGSVRFKSGKYEGQTYSEAPDEYIEFMAGKFGGLASKEMDRRRNGRQAQQTVQAGSNKFPASPFSR